MVTLGLGGCCVELFLEKDIIIWLVVSTHLKNISQIGNLPQIGMKIKMCLTPPPSYDAYDA